MPLLVLVSVYIAFVTMVLHDDNNHLQNSNNDIINSMNCNNYKYWIDYHKGDWLDISKDIRAKAEQVKESCK